MTQRLPSLSNYLATDVSEWSEQMITVRDHGLWRDADAGSWEDYCTRVVGKPLDWCSWIIGGYEELRASRGTRPVPEAEALEAGKRVAAMMAVAPDLAEHGGVRPSGGRQPVAGAGAVGAGKRVAAVMAGAPDLAEPRGSGTGGNQGYDVTLNKRGNQTSYLAARIKRDHPEIAAAVERGEYPSMRKAAIAAGIVKEPSTLDR